MDWASVYNTVLSCISVANALSFDADKNEIWIFQERQEHLVLLYGKWCNTLCLKGAPQCWSWTHPWMVPAQPHCAVCSTAC